MNSVDAVTYAKQWVQDWNAHDVEALLGHFSDDVVFTSPAAARLVEGSQGVIVGKEALRHYWREGIRQIPDLHFELVNVYRGVDALVINYRNQNGGLVNEVLLFEGALVIRGHATYLDDDSGANPESSD